MTNEEENPIQKRIKPIAIGSLSLPTNIVYAPLAGCSDLPFRQMARLFHKGLLFTEMVKMDALVRSDSGTFRLLDYTSDMHPIGAQICGSKAKFAAQSARMIEDLGFDLIDLNCGCPVDKVTKDGSGSGMLKTPNLIGEMIDIIVNTVRIPVTVKIRAGWDEENINAPEITQIVEQAGAKAVFLHGRTRAQAYRGPANWDYIAEARKKTRSIPLFGNGDIFSQEATSQIFNHTECDGVLIARGTLGKPWIAQEITDPNSLPTKDGAFHQSIILKHLHFIRIYQSEHRGLIDMRRVGCWYLQSLPGAKALREQLNRATSLSQVESLILAYPWETVGNLTE